MYADTSGHWILHFYLRLFHMFISQSVKLISDNIWIGLVLWHRLDVYDSSEFDSTGVKLYIFIHNEVRDFDKNSTQPEIRVKRVRDNESQLCNILSGSMEDFLWHCKKYLFGFCCCCISSAYWVYSFLFLWLWKQTNISRKNNRLSPQIIEHKITMTCYVGNPKSWLKQLTEYFHHPII
jgi:hypothetical protein